MGQRIDVNHENIYYGDFLAVEDVNINIEPNKVTSFIGPSGCGKSTVLRTLDRMHEIIPGAHVEGEVLLEGKNLYDKDVDPVAVRRDVGMVFQRPNPFPTMSIRENVLAGVRLNNHHLAKSDADDLVEWALRGANLWEEVKDRLDNPGIGLSGGQQQRVAIARALITKPKLVFADEPTGNLDSVSSAEVLGFLKRSVNELGQTIVMVTHDAVAASYADRAIVFADGQIVADEANPTAETMSELLMAERERATRTAVTSTRADTLARLAGVKDVPNLPITDAPLPPAGRTGTMRHARAAAQHAR